ncbi:Vancomycin resistance protein YoaR, contains peptidoglycan-binding and VanW domains [Lentzea fradiae]|uniref:Vancomycin resistance protein YoaR, contains peptidoglycan-binding and VanW domains n=2 Tax=Lentzea fradiae TaxID=200378 RepID=A0A1G7M4V8_9PSEU|nr:VanW family protein [Lentzea fradiae]SDF56812.1 Vancomycin resistance protein YoaR, contains peptidoglycan-binding and VanW domains [Lentzea fradiae]
MPPVGPGGTASEQTAKINPVQADAAAAAWPSEEPDAAEPTVQTAVPNVGFPAGEDATEYMRPVAPPQPRPEDSGVYGPVMIEPGQDEAGPKVSRKKALIVAAAVVGAFGLLYGLDILVSSGNVPRGVTVAGVDVGGMGHDEAEKKLRDEIGPRLSKPVALQAGDVKAELDPKAAGLELDWTRTIDRAGSQPLSPITRVTSFFTSREVGVATKADDEKVSGALEALRPQLDHDPIEGSIKFEGATPVAVEPHAGQKLKTEDAVGVVVSNWASGDPVEIPMDFTPVKTTKEGVEKALDEVVKTAVSGPVVIKGEGKDATLSPEQIGATLAFAPGEGGALDVSVNKDKLAEVTTPQLKDTIKEGKDAEIVFEGGRPAVKPSVDGLDVDWEKNLQPYFDTLKKSDGREVKFEYKHTPAKVTTEQANAMGIKEVIGEFQTGGFAADSGVNIRVVAEKVNGAIVKPKETFSLNKYTGPRGLAQGYVEAGIIENGIPGRAVGGGISQFATTLYNAYYYAGMKDAGHKEHSYWITRYPKGREATVFMDNAGNSLIDIAFTNPDDTGVAIQTIWTPSSLKIVLWGTKNYDVTGSTSGDFNPTQPQEKKVNKPGCSPSNGAPGFSVTDTRTITDRRTGQTRSESRTVRYDPQFKIICEPPPGG